jgi:hypothetical protein
MKYFSKIKLMLATVALIVIVGLSSCNMNRPVCATSNNLGSKVGKSTGQGYLGVINFYGNATIYNAAKNGGISKISTVDFYITDLLGLIQTYECVVTGE